MIKSYQNKLVVERIFQKDEANIDYYNYKKDEANIEYYNDKADSLLFVTKAGQLPEPSCWG